MRRVVRPVLIVVIGLGAAFGVFRALGWPSTLEGPGLTDVAGFGRVEAGELLHAGLGPFVVNGSRGVEITAVRAELSPGIDLESIRLSVVNDPGFVAVGALRGPNEEIDRLPGASGTTLRPGQTAFLVLSFRVVSPGEYRIPGVQVSYSSGWIRRTKILGPTVTAEMVPTATPSPSPT